MRSGVAIGMLVSALTVVGGGAVLLKPQEPGRGIGLPYSAPCNSHNDRCNLCKIYEKEGEYRRGRITKDELLRFIESELKWQRDSCGGSDPDLCRGLRNVCYDASARFSVHKVIRSGNECEDCASSTEHELFKGEMERGRGMRNKFEVVLRPSVGQLETRSTSIHEDPLWLTNRLYYEWEEAASDEVAPADYGVVMPSGIDGDESTWRFLPLPNGLKKDVIQALPSSAFDHPHGSGAFSAHLSRAVVCDPAAILVEVSGGQPSTVARIVHGTYLRHPFLFCEGYSDKGALKTYKPVQAGDATGPIIQGLIRAPLGTGVLQGELVLWLKAGSEQPAAIKGALRHADFLGLDPKDAIGNPQTGAAYSPSLAKAIANSTPNQLDWIFVSNYTNYVRRGTDPGPIPVHWLSDVSSDLTSHLYQLAIADPALEVIVSTEADESTPNVLVFTYGALKNKVYSWTWKHGEAPVQRLLIDGDAERFKLTGEKLNSYVQALNEGEVSSAEDSLFTGMALGRIKKDDVVWLDWFPEGDGVSARLVLCAAGPVQKIRGVMSVAVRKIGVGKAGVNNGLLSIKLTDAENEPSDFAAFLKRYRSDLPWKKRTFYDEVLVYGVPQDYWLSHNEGRVGVVTAYTSNRRTVVVLLKNKDKRHQFGPDLWEAMRDRIAKDQVIYMPSAAPTDPGILLRSCLKDDHEWDRAHWRANPLGYFDRIPNSGL